MSRFIFIVVLMSAPVGAIAAGDGVEEVIVTSTPMRESGLETAQPVAVVEGDALVRARAQTLGETLAAEPGISASYSGPQASRPIIRGQGGERVQMYEDGAEALDVSGLSGDHAVTIDPLIAESIEIVRGPATLLFGNGATGGLVNVLTHRIPSAARADPWALAFEARGDSALEERSLGARMHGGGERWAWHADAHARDAGDVSIPGFALSRRLRDELAAAGEAVDETRDRLPGSDAESAGGALGGSRIGAQGFIGGSVSRLESEYGVPGGEGVRIDLEQNRYDLSGELTAVPAALESVRVRGTYSDYEHAEIEPGGEIGTRFSQTGVDARVAAVHAPLAGWRGTAGVQLRERSLEAIGEEAFLPPSDTRNVGMFFYEERPFGPVTVELGARLERQSIDVGLADEDGYRETSVSGSAGLLWKLHDGYAVALHLTSSERHPTATELYANGPHAAAGRFEIGDAALERERALNVDLGVRRTAGAWQLAAGLFRTNYARYVFAAPTPFEIDGLPVVAYSQADARFYGFEAELELPPAEMGAVTFTTRVIADAVRAELDSGERLPQIPPLRYGAEARLAGSRFAGGISLTRHEAQDRVAADERPTDGYTMLDVKLEYRRVLEGGRTLLLFLSGDNLLDEDARRHSSPLKDIAPLPGRGISGGLRLELGRERS